MLVFDSQNPTFVQQKDITNSKGFLQRTIISANVYA